MPLANYSQPAKEQHGRHPEIITLWYVKKAIREQACNRQNNNKTGNIHVRNEVTLERVCATLVAMCKKQALHILSVYL
jgi:hypothetical protein